MPLPSLEDMLPGLDAACVSILGDTVEYRSVGAADFTTIKAFVEFSEAARDLSTGQVIDQDMSVEAFFAEVPVRPSQGSRIRLGALPGKTYRPVNVGRNVSGSGWIFGMETVDG